MLVDQARAIDRAQQEEVIGPREEVGRAIERGVHLDVDGTGERRFGAERLRAGHEFTSVAMGLAWRAREHA